MNSNFPSVLPWNSVINKNWLQIYMTGWWLCPELYLRRPFHSHSSSRLDALLEAKAKQGVQVQMWIALLNFWTVFVSPPLSMCGTTLNHRLYYTYSKRIKPRLKGGCHSLHFYFYFGVKLTPFTTYLYRLTSSPCLYTCRGGWLSCSRFFGHTAPTSDV